MPLTIDYRPQGRRLTAKDLAERLLPDLHMNEFIGWAPDLFAFTSYMMSNTGAYQLVVSPPTKGRWEPTNKELKEWLGVEWNGKEWLAVGEETPSIILERWLRSFLIEKYKEGAKEWVLDIGDADEEEKKKENYYDKKWRHLDHPTGYFSSEFMSILEKVDDFDNQITAIAEHIGTHVLTSLTTAFEGEDAEILLKDYKSKGKSEAEKEIADIKDEITEIEDDKEMPDGKKKEEIQTRREKIKKIKGKIKELEEMEKISLSDFLKNDKKRNWIQFVQKLGDDWNE